MFQSYSRDSGRATSAWVCSRAILRIVEVNFIAAVFAFRCKTHFLRESSLRIVCVNSLPSELHHRAAMKFGTCVAAECLDQFSNMRTRHKTRVARKAASLVEVSAVDGSTRELSGEKFFNIARIVWLPQKTGLLMIAGKKSEGYRQLWRVSYPSQQFGSVLI